MNGYFGVFKPLITFIMVNIAFSESLFLKNALISERNVVTLCTGIEIMSFLFYTLKLLISCDIGKNPMPFFVPISLLCN